MRSLCFLTLVASTLAWERPEGGKRFTEWKFTTLRHWGEQADAGPFTIRVADMRRGSGPNGTYSYAPQQYILYGIEYDHSVGFSGGNLTYGNISGPVVLLKREEICGMRPNFKYEGKVVAVNLPDMDILAWTGQSESSRILFVLLDNPNLGVPPPGVLEY